jgi:hypothetical protein
MVGRLAMVIVVATLLGVAGSRIELTATEIQLHDRYYVVSLGAAPLVFLAVLLVGVTLVARGVGVWNRMLVVAWHATVIYIVLKLGAWYVVKDSLGEPGSLVHLIQPRGALALLWHGHVGAALLAVVMILASMVGLVRHARRSPQVAV